LFVDHERLKNHKSETTSGIVCTFESLVESVDVGPSFEKCNKGTEIVIVEITFILDVCPL